MWHETNHLSDQEILLTVDEELPALQQQRINAHLASCEMCYARFQKIQTVSSNFVGLHRSDTTAALPPADAARALLKSRLAAASAAPQQGPWAANRIFTAARVRWVTVAAALLISAFGYWAFRRDVMMPKKEPKLSSAAWNNPIPDRQLTPGATISVTTAEVCRSADTEETHPIPPALQQKVFQEYRTLESQAGQYEVDFLITPGLGGADDIRNLWLEPYSSTVWNAHVKDALEDRLHDMVCSGKLDLATAQHDIATDWISAYKKYFHTENPPSNSSTSNPNRL